MAHLDAEPADLLRVADDYTELATRTTQLSPQALDEIKRIAVTHGPMGYPTIVGITTGMAARQARLHAKAADFDVYAERFREHAAAYLDQDHANAARLAALDFPQAHIDPTPPPREPAEYPVVCWLPNADADPAQYCPADTTRIEYVDGEGQWIQKDIGTGANEVVMNGALPGVDYLPGPPAGPAAPGITDRLWPDEHGNLVHEHRPDPGEPPTIDVLPPGRISW